MRRDYQTNRADNNFHNLLYENMTLVIVVELVTYTNDNFKT